VQAGECVRVYFKRLMSRDRVSSDQKIRCFVIHDHVLLRHGLRRLLEDEADMEVVAEAGTAVEALRGVAEQRPEIVIADTNTFGSPADQVERLIQRESPESKVVFLTAQDGDAALLEGLADGANWAGRATSAKEFVEAIRRAHSGGNAQERKERGLWLFQEPHARKRALTSREREVLKLLAEGRTVRSVAVTLGVSVKTIDAHKFNLMRKLGVHNKAELVMWAIQKRVVKLPANF
jgi:two-component system, NarL family, response regulator NreC